MYEKDEKIDQLAVISRVETKYLFRYLANRENS